MFEFIFIILIILIVTGTKKVPPKTKGYVRRFSDKAIVRTVDGGTLGTTIFINPLKEYFATGGINDNIETDSTFNFLVTTRDNRNYIALLSIKYKNDGATDITPNQMVSILKSDVTKYTKKFISEIPDSQLRSRIFEVPNKVVREVNSRLVKYTFKLTSVKIALNKPGANTTLNNNASNDGISDNYSTNRAKPDCVHEDPGYVSKAQRYKNSGAIEYDNYIDNDDDGITVFGSDNGDNPIKESISLTSLLNNTIESDYNDDDDDPIKNL